MNSFDSGRAVELRNGDVTARTRVLLLGSTVFFASLAAGPVVLSSTAYAASGGAGGAGVYSNGGAGGDTNQSGSAPPNGLPGTPGAAGGIPGGDGGDGVAAANSQAGPGGGGGGDGTVGTTGGGVGGDGGDAGNNGDNSSGGGGGGGGGNGIGSLTNDIFNFGSIVGGVGGAGGDGGRGVLFDNAANGGDGGDGGAGIVVTAPATITNGGNIFGGNGGIGGGGSFGTINQAGSAGAAGAGGVGITGANVSIVNGGAIAGGVSGDGAAQASAIEFTGGTNVLTITSTSNIFGNVVAFSTADTLGLGGATNGALNLSQVGPAAKYQGFGILSKSGASVWTLSGATAGGPALNYVVTAGELNLGTTSQTAGSLLLTGGTLSNGTLTVNGANPAGFDVQAGIVSAVLAGTAGLTKTTAGTVTLLGANTYSGGTSVNAGVLALSGVGTLGDPGNTTTVTGGILELGTTTQTQNTLTQSGGIVQNGQFNVVTATLSGGTNSAELGNFAALPATPEFRVTTFTQSGGTYAGTAVSSTYVLDGALAEMSGEVNASTAIDARAGSVTGVLSGVAGLTKTTAGTVTLLGANTYSGGTTVNAGTLALSGAGTLGATTGTTTVNGGALDLGATTQTQAGLIQNAGSTVQSTGGPGVVNVGTYTLNGGTLASGVTVSASTGHQLRAGTVNGVLAQAAPGVGAVKTTAGLVTLNGVNTYTGLTDVQAGALTIGTTGSVAGAVTNALNAVTNVDGSVGGAFGNSGELNLISGTIGGALTNNATGETNVSGANTVGSIVNSGGLISLQNGVFTDSLTTTAGGYSATGAARIALDFNNTAPNGAQDSVDFNGTASGVTTVNIQEFGARRLFAPQTVIFTNAVAPGAAFNGVFSGNDGLIAYDLVQQGNDFAIVSSLDANAAGAAAGAVTSSVVAVGTGFIDAASAFISAPANPEADQVTFGFWGRTKGGKYDIDTDTDVSVAGGTDSSASTTFRTSFWGYQFGADFGRLNVGGSGVNLHAGLTAGDIDIDTDAKNGSSHADTKAPFIGIYGAATGGGFFADLQVQRNFYKMKLDVPAADLRNDKVKGDGYSIVFSGGKVIPLNDTWFIEPSVGLNYVRVDTDNVRFDSVGTVRVDDVESLLGRLGLRVGTAFQASEKLILRPAVAASVWHEFQGDAGSSFVPDLAGTPSADIKTSRIGTFGQIGLSLSGQMVDSGLLGFVRADYRKGKDIDGYAFTGGLRTQF